METSKQQKIRELVLVFLKDGTPKHISDIRKYLFNNGVTIEDGSSALRTALHSMRLEYDELQNPEKGVYVWNEKCQKEKKISGNEYDFADFITVQPSSKRATKMVVSVLPDGTFAVNTPLLKCFSSRHAEVRLKADGSQMLLIENGVVLLNFGKNGRIKNYNVVAQLQDLNIKLPLYYVGEWNEEKRMWIGNLSPENPNRTRRH